MIEILMLIATQASPLTLDTLLDSVSKTHPERVQAERSLEAAKARVMSAEGGFDPMLTIKSDARPLDPYRNGYVDAELQQPTALWGIRPLLGYRLGRGNFQDYKAELFTEEFGELRAGVEIPFWRGGLIDDRRANLGIARAGAKQADCSTRLRFLKLDRRAADAYWSWVAAGLQVEIQEELFSVARDRQNGLARQAEQGNIPQILVVDNRRLVLDRESRLVATKQRLQDAATHLSLYLRDDKERPQRPILAQLPSTIAHPEELELPALAQDLELVERLRPEVCLFQNMREQVRIKLKLAQNNIAPVVTSRAYFSQDFISSGAAPGTSELGIGLRFEMPLLLREARGKAMDAKAERALVEAEMRGTLDGIRAEIIQARIDLVAAHDQVLLSRGQRDLSRRLAEAERRKLSEGASDLVVVNLRELAVAEAERLNIVSLASYRKAEVNYLVATGRGLRVQGNS